MSTKSNPSTEPMTSPDDLFPCFFDGCYDEQEEADAFAEYDRRQQMMEKLLAGPHKGTA